MKRLFSCIVLISIILGFFSPASLSANDQNYFIVTAYYSPLPDQEYYSMGSYAAEVRLNGQGIAGASGRNVFSGMLAAPAKYPFGTKIQLEGLGVGSVEDRGGAIVPAGERGYNFDRIDVWMGYGDEGLRRAMYWGKRKVAGNIVARNTQPTINYYNSPAPYWASSMFQKQVVTKPVVQLPGIFEASLESGNNEILVGKLQSLLGELGYLTDEFTQGKYDDATLEAVYNFQVDSEILYSKEIPGAGRYGPKTRIALKRAYDSHLVALAEKEAFLATLVELEKSAIVMAQEHVDSIGKPLYADISPEVRELQKTLAKLDYFEYKDTAIFGTKTQNAIIDFQIANELIQNGDDIGAGIFGPKTRASFIEELSDTMFEELLEEAGITEKYETHILNQTDVKQESTEQELVEETEQEVSTKIKTQYAGISV
ncbi:peptidoglycan-binding protein [Candidatus Gracilibacteria bacterium]|nr:peptidoglycan-binding protein [Candidatus Gracilibacteria bacterium]